VRHPRPAGGGHGPNRFSHHADHRDKSIYPPAGSCPGRERAKIDLPPPRNHLRRPQIDFSHRVWRAVAGIFEIPLPNEQKCTNISSGLWRFRVCFRPLIDAHNRGQLMTELLTRRQAAALLGIHVSTLDRWTRIGLMTAVRVGPRAVRYTAGAISQVLRPKAQA
jgi:excisionase family DNA binding protein